MNPDRPPIRIVSPQSAARAKQKPQRQPVSPELLARRAEVARSLGVKVQSLSAALQALSDAERKAVFYKLTHDGAVDLTGTGLKPLTDRSERVTLAVSPKGNITPFAEKLKGLETAAPKGAGFLPNQDLLRIEDIEEGDPLDRLSDELVSQYEQLILEPSLICELELLSLKQGEQQQRKELATALADLRQDFASGVHGTVFEHEEIKGTCRVVVRCTGKMFQRLVQEEKWRTRISWFEPKPQFSTFQEIANQFDIKQLGDFHSPPDDAPVVCVVDSGVTAGNPFLQPVSKEELFQSFLRDGTATPYDEYGHGSGVASLAAYYALNLAAGATNAGRVWIASARILNHENQLEDQTLFSKVLREVVGHFAPLGVKIFNLSVGDAAKTWNQDSSRTMPRKSWVARTIDCLSREYDVIFVVSSGNLTEADVADYLPSGDEYPCYLLNKGCRLLDPAQAALALTVGSVAPGTLTVSSTDPAVAEVGAPSPFTRCGPGMRGEAKPELVEFGGNFTRSVDGGFIRRNQGSGVVVARHTLSPATSIKCGTSLAAPRVAHKLAVLSYDLAQLGLNDLSAPLLKAFLISSAGYDSLVSFNETAAILNDAEHKSWLNVVGYGFPTPDRAVTLDDYRVALYYEGALDPDRVYFFDVPVPADLHKSQGQKRISVTLCHYPEVQPWGLERYLGVDIKWKVFRGDLSRDEIINAMSDEEDEASSEGSEVKDLQFEHKVTRRSRGTVQHDRFTWTRHAEHYSSNHYTLAVATYRRWQRRVTPTRVGIVVWVEDLGREVPIYAAIEQSIEALQVEV